MLCELDEQANVLVGPTAKVLVAITLNVEPVVAFAFVVDLVGFSDVLLPDDKLAPNVHAYDVVPDLLVVFENNVNEVPAQIGELLDGATDGFCNTFTKIVAVDTQLVPLVTVSV